MVYAFDARIPMRTLLILALGLGCDLWALAHHWSTAGQLAVAAAGLLAGVAAATLVDVATTDRYTGWRLDPGPTLVLTYRYLFGLATRERRFDLSTVRTAHADSFGRLVLRAADGRVTTWLHWRTRSEHPDIDTAVQDALRAYGVKVSVSPPRPDGVLTDARARARRLATIEMDELERALEAGEDLPDARRPWQGAWNVWVPSLS